MTCKKKLPKPGKRSLDEIMAEYNARMDALEVILNKYTPPERPVKVRRKKEMMNQEPGTIPIRISYE